MISVTGRRCPPGPEALQSTLSALLDAEFSRPDDHVTLLLDAHYPYHPSTGLVTNPAVVTALVEALRDRGVDVALCCAPDSAFSTDQALALLGYDDVLERSGVSRLDTDAAVTGHHTVRVGTRSVPVSLPEPLVANPVVAVPTLRRYPPDPPRAGMDLTARSVLAGEPTPAETAAVAAVCDPALTVLDGTYTFVGEPHATDVLLASTDVVALDSVAAWIAGVPPDDVPSAHLWRTRSDVPPVEGLDAERVRRALSDTDSGKTEDGPSRAVEAGYRMYSRVSDDLVPPQFLPEAGP